MPVKPLLVSLYSNEAVSNEAYWLNNDTLKVSFLTSHFTSLLMISLLLSVCLLLGTLAASDTTQSSPAASRHISSVSAFNRSCSLDSELPLRTGAASHPSDFRLKLPLTRPASYMSGTFGLFDNRDYAYCH